MRDDLESNVAMNKAGKRAGKRAGRAAVAGPRWRDPEFKYVYHPYIGFMLVLLMYTSFLFSEKYRLWAEDVTAETSGLKDSWLTPLLGRKIDAKDHQWKEFRNALPSIFGLVAASVILSRGFTGMLVAKGSKPGTPAFMFARGYFYAALGAGFVYHLHGTMSIVVALIALGNFYMTRVFRESKILPIFVWGYAIFAMFHPHKYDGYRWSHLPGFLGGGSSLAKWADGHRGATRWHVLFNLFVLRMISYSMDHYWWWWRKPNGKDVVAKEKVNSSKSRIISHRPQAQYESLSTYFAYLFYPPCYLAGPTQTFNAFASHLERPQKSSFGKPMLKLYFRFVASLLLFEVMQHYLYLNGITANLMSTQGDVKPGMTMIDTISDDGTDAFSILCYSFMALVFIWFKFLLIWRLARCWAMMDGIDVPENMRRCMLNNYTISGFWKGWHASYNRWLIRYLFIPLGGSRVGMLRQIGNIFVVFTFVAVWHDRSMQLLSWGWLFVLFMAAELMGKKVGSIMFRGSEGDTSSWRHAVAFVGTINISALLFTNLIGFAYSIEGMKKVIRVMDAYDVFGVSLFLVFFYVAVHWMQEWRRQERLSLS